MGNFGHIRKPTPAVSGQHFGHKIDFMDGGIINGP